MGRHPAFPEDFFVIVPRLPVPGDMMNIISFYILQISINAIRIMLDKTIDQVVYNLKKKKKIIRM